MWPDPLWTYAEGVFNLSGSEIIFLLLAGLVILGPERLPTVLRRAVKTYSEFRRFAAGIEKELRETFDEPLKEIRGTADEITKTIKGLDPGFGEVDTEPSPPMRPEQPVRPDEIDEGSSPSETDEN
jgi:sec-independent protein translocase protein TatB